MIPLLLSPAAPAQVAKLLPKDEAARNPELFAFRARLQAAVARHDAEAVLATVDPNVKNSFGGNDGITEFRRTWRLPGGESELWGVLGSLLALGGAFQNENTFVAPYVFTEWPENVDPFEHVAVLGTDVRVRAAPSLDSPVLTALSFDVVRRAGASQGGEWTAVRLRDGRTGYVASRFLRSQIDYRAFLSRQSGQWRLVLLLAGD